MKISPTRWPGRCSGRMAWSCSTTSSHSGTGSFRNPSDTRCCSEAPMCSNASISLFPSVSCPVRRRFAGGISRHAPTPVRGGISARSWPTCSDVTPRSRRRWSGSPRRLGRRGVVPLLGPGRLGRRIVGRHRGGGGGGCDAGPRVPAAQKLETDMKKSPRPKLRGFFVPGVIRPDRAGPTAPPEAPPRSRCRRFRACAPHAGAWFAGGPSGAGVRRRG